jgi:hypothetical protein
VNRKLIFSLLRPALLYIPLRSSLRSFTPYVPDIAICQMQATNKAQSRLTVTKHGTATRLRQDAPEQL